MPIRRETLYWNSQSIGFIEDLRADNFELFGIWIPVEGENLNALLATLAISDEEPIEIGETRRVAGRINSDSIQGNNISVKLKV